MRRKRLLVAPVALAAGLAIVLAGPAGAQEGDGGSEEEIIHEAETLAEENGGTEFDAECIAILAEGGSVDDCQEAPNPLLPETNEIIWGAIGFIVVFFFLWKYGMPQVRTAMTNRTEKIRDDLQAAEDQRAQADALLTDYRAQLNDAKTEAGRIIEEARQAADQIKRDQEARLQDELADLRARAIADIDSAKAQAMTDLRGEVAALAIGAAETVVQHNLDSTTQTQLVEDYINQVAAQRA
jgi:F-type H+-transporting ATPase subunit b